MRKLLSKIGDNIRVLIDFFYPPFQRFMSLSVFRYAACGGANMVFGWVLYFLAFHFVLQKQMLHLGIVTLSSHIAALAIAFPISTLTGFLLQKYVTFMASELRGKTQMMRYFLVVGGNLLVNYIGLKFFVEVLHFFPTPSKMLTTSITVVLSYVFQSKFTFRT